MAAKKSCLNCGNGFIGRADASYCSPTCRQRARRSRGGAKCDTPVTDTAPAPRARRRPATTTAAPSTGSDPGVHSAEAQAVLAGLDAELASNSRRLGLARPLKWSTAEEALRAMIADQIDRKVELQRRWHASTDDHARVKLSAEIRLLEGSAARLLAQVKTDLPAPASLTSVKAKRAANTRWKGVHASDR